MKFLMLSAACFLLASQLSAQGTVSMPAQPVTTVAYNYNTNTTVNGVSNSYSYNSNQNDLDDPMKAKTYTKSFPLDKNDFVNLANSYGGMTIKTWDKNEIKVDADIKAYANTEGEAQKLLDNASIEASKNGDLVSFKTNIGSINGNWGNGSRNGKKWRRELKIFLTVYMPAGNALKASQQYGNLTLADFSGATTLSVQYGNLIAGDLKSNKNDIHVQYGKADLQTLNNADINIQYGGGLTIVSVNNLELEAQYCAAKIGSAKNAHIKHQYGSGFNIGNAGNVSATVQYAGIRIDNLTGNFTSKVQYGKVNIAQVANSVKTFNADLDYTPINLSFADNYNADFSVAVEYGSFNYGNKVSAKKTFDNDQKKSYEGRVGNGGSNSIRINSEYDSITFK